MNNPDRVYHQYIEELICRYGSPSVTSAFDLGINLSWVDMMVMCDNVLRGLLPEAPAKAVQFLCEVASAVTEPVAPMYVELMAEMCHEHNVLRLHPFMLDDEDARYILVTAAMLFPGYDDESVMPYLSGLSTIGLDPENDIDVDDTGSTRLAKIAAFVFGPSWSALYDIEAMSYSDVVELVLLQRPPMVNFRMIDSAGVSVPGNVLS